MSERTLGDVLTCISAPRWHLLSWVLDWPTLQDRCSGLLKDPESRLPGGIKRELKYLVIDYTQFEEWSSEEEILFNNGESPVPDIFGLDSFKKFRCCSRIPVLNVKRPIF